MRMEYSVGSDWCCAAQNTRQHTAFNVRDWLGVDAWTCSDKELCISNTLKKNNNQSTFRIKAVRTPDHITMTHVVVIMVGNDSQSQYQPPFPPPTTLKVICMLPSPKKIGRVCAYIMILLCGVFVRFGLRVRVFSAVRTHKTFLKASRSLHPNPSLVIGQQ